MENLNRKELLASTEELAKLVLNTKLINMESVNKGYFQFKESIDGVRYFITFKYDDISNLSFHFGCKVSDVLNADCFDIEEVNPAFNRDKRKTLVHWEYE